MKRIFFFFALILSFSAQAQQPMLEFFSIESATMTAQYEGEKYATPVTRVEKKGFGFQPIGYGKTKLKIKSNLPLSLMIVTEDRNGQIVVLRDTKARKEWTTTIDAKDGDKFTITPFTAGTVCLECKNTK